MKKFAKALRTLHKGESGFTLIELLIVIVILGIIAGVVALYVGGFMGTGCKEAAMMEKDSVQTAVLAYMVDTDNPEFSGDVGGADLTPYLHGSISGTWSVTSGVVEGNYTCPDGTTVWTFGSGAWSSN